MRSIEHEVLFETIRQSAFPLHAGCSRGLLRRSDRFREPAALRISCRKRPEKWGFSTTGNHHCLLGKVDGLATVTDPSIRRSRQNPSEVVTRMWILRIQRHCDLIMSDCLVERTPPQMSISEAGVGNCIVGLELETCLQISDCLVGATLCKKNVTAVVIGVCIIGLQSYCLAVMDHRFVG